MLRSVPRLARGIFVALTIATPAVVTPAVATSTGATSETFRTPSVAFANVEWSAAVDQLDAEMATRPEIAAAFNFPDGRLSRHFDRRRVPALARLNALTAPLFPTIGRSSVPVLLPFDVGAFLSDRLAGAPESLAPARYQADFRAVDFFHAGPAGYDAVFSMEPGATSELPSRVFAQPVEVHITGSLVTYEVAESRGEAGAPVKTLATQFPDLRRLIREGFVRYAFTRFGVAYVVSINCLDSGARSRRLACREAYPVAERFLKALRVTGGTPAGPRAAIASTDMPRPPTQSADFTFMPPGAIIPGTGYRGKGGGADRTVYAQIRFPLARAPAFANSQLYRSKTTCPKKENGADKEAGAAAAKAEAKPEARPETKPEAKPEANSETQPELAAAVPCPESGFERNRVESAAENYAYPWRDNFCERRDFEVGTCPAGMGHQGQDLRPATCVKKFSGPGGCLPLQHAVVAARDGLLMRSPKQQSVLLLVNERNEHIRFRYVHMSPLQMNANGALNGRRVAEGEEFGHVANYQDYPGGTTTHLHFDTQVFTRDGWIWVNPYVTLISAYERLIGASGREIGALAPAATPIAAAATASARDGGVPDEPGTAAGE